MVKFQSAFSTVPVTGYPHADSDSAFGAVRILCRMRAVALQTGPGFTWMKKAQSNPAVPDRLLVPIFQQPILTGRNVVDGFENAGKVEGIVVAERGGDFLHAHHRLVQQTAGVLHAQANEAVNGRAAGLPFEQREEVGRGNICLGGERGHLQRLVQMPQHVGDALFNLPDRFRFARFHLITGIVLPGRLRRFDFDGFHWYFCDKISSTHEQYRPSQPFQFC